MTWTRFEGRYPQSRKVKPLSDGGFRADVEAICWSNEEGTDGRITAEELDLIGRGGKPKNAAELVRRGRWHKAGTPACDSDKCPHDGTAGDGWVIHDFHDYQPTREKVLRELDARRERNRRYMEKARRGRRESTEASQDAHTDPSYPPSTGAHTDAPQDLTPYRSGPPRSEGSGGGTPPSAPDGSGPTPAASSAGGAAGAADKIKPRAAPDTVRRLAAEARANLRQPATPPGRRPDAFAELVAATSASDEAPNQEGPST